MQQGPGKKFAFLFSLGFPYRHHFQFTKSPLKLYCIGTLGCVFSILCPSPNDAILCIFFQLNVLDGFLERHIFLQFLYRIHWSDMSNPFISLQCLVYCDVFPSSFPEQRRRNVFWRSPVSPRWLSRTWPPSQCRSSPLSMLRIILYPDCHREGRGYSTPGPFASIGTKASAVLTLVQSIPNPRSQAIL